MNDSYRRHSDRMRNVRTFLDDSAADIAPTSALGRAAARYAAIITEFETAAAAQVSGAGSAGQGFADKRDARDRVNEDLKNINLAARGLEYEIPNITERFRLPYNNNDEELLATARSFKVEAEPIAADLIRYELAEDFLADLTTDIGDFEQSDIAAGSGVESRAGATGDLHDIVLRGNREFRLIDSQVKLKYRNNPAKLAAWKTASHLEKAPRKKTDKNTPPK